MDWLTDGLTKLCMAAAFGAVLGLEREWKGKAAGFRTLMLVSIGSCLFTILSMDMAMQDPYHRSDLTRIASNVLTGIGFIGAGIIFREEMRISGLTTAATVWVSGAIGMCVGLGDYELAMLTTGIVWIILVIFNRLGQLVERYFDIRVYQILVRRQSGQSEDFLDTIDRPERMKFLEVKTELREQGLWITWRVQASVAAHETLVRNLVSHPRVESLTY